MKMNLKGAETSNASSKEEEKSEYYLTTPQGSAPDSKQLCKSESRDQPKNSPSTCSDSPSTDGNPANSFTAQYNGFSPSSSPSSSSSSRQPFGSTTVHSTDGTMLIPRAMQLDSDQCTLLRTVDALPPVTKETLSELDLDRIMRNINLRVDVNFDHGLHFMPVDGGKARERRSSAAHYYDALGTEISIYTFCATNGITSDKADGDSDASHPVERFHPRIPGMLQTLQEVLETLVPERDLYSVNENLDVPFLMQQIKKGVLNLVGLSRWLGDLLKSHCAPMRDPLVDRMVAEIGDGCAAQDMSQVAQGLKSMFGALEAMKLDVANHQIRAFRIVLVEDTVRFLRSHFYGRIVARSVNVEGARQWYLGISRQYSPSNVPQRQPDPFAPVKVLFKGVLAMLSSYDPPNGFPVTFEFDVRRLWRLRSDIQDVICLEICYHVFNQLAISRNLRIPASPEAYLALRTCIRSILDGCETGPRETWRWQNNASNIALEITRAVGTLESGLANNSSTSYSIVTNVVDRELLCAAEKALESAFTGQSSLFANFQETAREKLETETCELARRYLPMSPLEICDAQVHRSSSTRVMAFDLENIPRRLAHIGVLHWKVWAPLLYARHAGQLPEPEAAPLLTNDDDVVSPKLQHLESPQNVSSA